MEKQLRFDVKGMTCDNCVHHVTEAAKQVPGVREVKVSLAENSATVTGDFAPEQVVEAIAEEGYEAKVAAA